MVASTTGVTTSIRAQGPSVAQLWEWLAEVPDPEIPVVSVVDLGIVREVSWSDADRTAIVAVTPTYSGCPATDVIAKDIRAHLLSHGVSRVQLQVRLSPAWTTDWLSEGAKEKLRAFGIAPPTEFAAAAENGLASSLMVLGQRGAKASPVCPLCGSVNTEMISRFGSTPCKSLHRCLSCLEPFDHFKCH